MGRKEVLTMNEGTDLKQLRSFGLLVGGIFLIIGCWPVVVVATDPRWWAVVLGGVLLIMGLLLPRKLELVYRGWMYIGHALGWINTRILLGAMFYGLITPMGMAMRLLGKEPMCPAFEPNADTYRVFRQARPGSHMKDQF